MPDAPAGDALATARQTAWSAVRIATLGEHRALRTGEPDIIAQAESAQRDAEAAMDTLVAAARAEGAAEEREACIPLVCTMCRDGIKRTGPNAEGRCHHHVKVPGITVLVTQDCRASGIHVRARSPSSGTAAP